MRGRDRILRARTHGPPLPLDARRFKLWGTPRGFFWIPANFDSFFYIPAEQEIKIYGSGQYGVQPGDIVLDCGANVGVFRMEALSLRAKLVVAIEPSPKKVECLRCDFETQITECRLIVYPKSVWNEDALLPMSLHRNGVPDSFVIDDRSVEWFGKVELPTTTVGPAGG